MKNKIISFVSFLAVTFVFSSCLKDDVGEYWKDDLAGKMYATVAKATLQTLPLKPVAGEVPFEFLLNIATDALPTEDITITLKIDPAAVTEYNTNYNKAYKPYPYVDITTKTVTIVKGTRNAYAKAKVWGAEGLDACDNYMAAITIESAKTASGQDVTIGGNMKSYLVALPISNPYSGTYHASGVFTHPVNGPRDIDEDKELSTIDCKTVTCSAGDLGGDSGTWVLLTVNADNTITIGGSLTATQPYKPQTGKVNKYDPATKTFILNYYYEGGTGNRLIQENIVRK
jgi:hypothetical protein